ncbi:tetratricopeptide repeat protein [Acidobacteria bacterium AH-259-G07]|nr:tetratricopeptide repeat protein [Acidobacteria bacterium AH-259-G07]
MPFTTHTLAGPDGKFKFKKLIPAMYTLIIAVPRWGKMHQTIEVGPSFADSKGRIEETFYFDSNHSTKDAQTVSVRQLAIPKKARQEYQKAEDRLGKHDVPGAVEHLKKAVDRAPQFSAAWNLLGTIAYQSEDYRQAEQYFREALKQAPDSYSPLVNLGGTLLSQGRAKDALPINLRAVIARPDDPLAHSQLGQNHFMLGQLEKAERHLNQSKALDPRHFSYPQLVLAEIFRLKQDYAALVGELEDFLEYHPDSELAPELAELLKQTRAYLKKRALQRKGQRPDQSP